MYIQEDKNASIWDKYFPFDDLITIKELIVIIRPDFNCKEWGNDFSKGLLNLKELEVLKIRDESNGVMLLKALKLLVKNCKLLKNIISVQIDSEITSLLEGKNGVFNRRTLGMYKANRRRRVAESNKFK